MAKGQKSLVTLDGCRARIYISYITYCKNFRAVLDWRNVTKKRTLCDVILAKPTFLVFKFYIE